MEKIPFNEAVEALNRANKRHEIGSARLFIDASDPNITPRVMRSLGFWPGDNIFFETKERFSGPGFDFPAGTKLPLDPKTFQPIDYPNAGIGLNEGFQWIIGGRSTLGFLAEKGVNFPGSSDYIRPGKSQ